MQPEFQKFWKLTQSMKKKNIKLIEDILQYLIILILMEII